MKDRLAALGKHREPSTSKPEQIFHEVNPDNLQDPIVYVKLCMLAEGVLA